MKNHYSNSIKIEQLLLQFFFFSKKHQHLPLFVPKDFSININNVHWGPFRRPKTIRENATCWLLWRLDSFFFLRTAGLKPCANRVRLLLLRPRGGVNAGKQYIYWSELKDLLMWHVTWHLSLQLCHSSFFYFLKITCHVFIYYFVPKVLLSIANLKIFLGLFFNLPHKSFVFVLHPELSSHLAPFSSTLAEIWQF